MPGQAFRGCGLWSAVIGQVVDANRTLTIREEKSRLSAGMRLRNLIHFQRRGWKSMVSHSSTNRIAGFQVPG